MQQRLRLRREGELGELIGAREIGREDCCWSRKWRQGKMREGKIGKLRREQSNLSSTEVMKLLNSHKAVIEGMKHVCESVRWVCKMES